jgi:rare lipoprotein A
MNQRHLWTIAALFLTILGMPSVGRTQVAEGKTQFSRETPATNVVKVGEYQSPARKQTLDAVITEILPYNIGGRQAATLYIRNVPVLTFLGSSSVTNLQTKVGEIGDGRSKPTYALIASNSLKSGVWRDVADVENDPVQRAGEIASRINQLVQDDIDASQITVSWKAGDKSNQNQIYSSQPQLGDRYIIKVNGKELVEINRDTRLADTTKNLAQDALQATNRLRRLIGKASPLSEIAGLPAPKLSLKMASRRMRINFTGMASWYGYDGSASSTASGERFNPEGLTAAHRSLPLGTRVRVTNTRNGRSVVVRINDRGPYVGGRIIDLSAAAARILGMMGTGIAPVKIDILGR